MSTEDNQIPTAPSLFDQFRPAEAPALPEGEHPPEDLETSLPEDDLTLTDEYEGLETTEPELTSNVETGIMPGDARRAMRYLLNTGVVREEKKRLTFEALCRHEKLIGEHLGNMYLYMLLDQKAGIAILLEQEVTDPEGGEEEDEDEGSSLIGKRTLSLYDTLLLLVLRKYYQERESAGEQKIVIDIDSIAALLTPFVKLTNNSSLERKQLNGSLKLMREKRLLASVRGSDDRVEITPVIRYVVNADFLTKLLGEYEQLAAQSGIPQQQVDEDV